jgi:hypothetical protein
MMTHLLLRYSQFTEDDFLNGFAEEDEAAVGHVDERLEEEEEKNEIS